MYEVSRDMVTKASTEGGLDIKLDSMSFVTAGPRPDMPATGVSWNEAARFVNWLNTSQGYPPAYQFAMQPGDAGYSANANILLWQSGDPGYNAANPLRNSLAYYFLPSFDEWFKAAYYDPNANGGVGGYWDYPTGSDTEPIPVSGGTAAGTAVYLQPFEQGPADIHHAGGLSPYGVMGLGGNVWEWEETEFDLVNDDSTSFRGVRGGNWFFDSFDLDASYRDFGVPSVEGDDVGFRVASIPEPNTMLLGFLAAAGLMLRTKDSRAGVKALDRVVLVRFPVRSHDSVSLGYVDEV
jgi:formylglycine-generating enzyme required for sulfatase activity